MYNLIADNVPVVVAGKGVACPREEVMVNETFGTGVPPTSVNIVQLPECEADLMHKFGREAKRQR